MFLFLQENSQNNDEKITKEAESNVSLIFLILKITRNFLTFCYFDSKFESEMSAKWKQKFPKFLILFLLAYCIETAKKNFFFIFQEMLEFVPKSEVDEMMAEKDKIIFEKDQEIAELTKIVLDYSKKILKYEDVIKASTITTGAKPNGLLENNVRIYLST